MCEDFIKGYFFFLAATFFLGAALRFAGFLAATFFFATFFFAAIYATSLQNFFYRELMTIVTRVHSLDQIYYTAL